MSRITILERDSSEELTNAINELLEDGWAIAQGHYQVCPKTLFRSRSYSIIMINNEPHVPVTPETLAMYQAEE